MADCGPVVKEIGKTVSIYRVNWRASLKDRLSGQLEMKFGRSFRWLIGGFNRGRSESLSIRKAVSKYFSLNRFQNISSFRSKNATQITSCF